MLKLAFFLAFILAFVSPQDQNSTASPDLVIELFRHGARAPLRANYAEGWYPYEFSQLTPVGMREHYLLGRALVDEYPDILGQPYNLSKIYVRSSTTDRSVESAQAQMYGIYEGRGPALSANSSYPSQRASPPFQSASIEQINQNLNNSQAVPGGFVAIAANTTSNEGGVNLIEPSTVVCFNLFDDILENVLGDESTQFWKDLEPTRQTLENSGISVNNPLELGVLGDVFVCDYYDDRPLPGNVDPQSEVYKNITFARNWYFVQALWGAPQQRQLLSVPLFSYILDYFDRKTAGTTDLEFIFLSTAETNLLHLLTTLNIVTADCLMANYRAELAGQERPYLNCNYTEFASNVILELYNSSGSPNVVFKYNGVAIPVCSNSTVCSLSEFKTLITQSTNGYSVDDYDDNCLENSLPSLQRIFEQAGYAFQAQQSGVSMDISEIRNEILGEESGETGGLLGYINNAAENAQTDASNAAENVQSGLGNIGENISNAAENARSDLDNARDNIGNRISSRIGSFLGGN